MEDEVRETLTRLLTDHSQSLKRLVETAERLLRIDKATGHMVLAVPSSYISDRDFIGLLLLSKHFAHGLGLTKKETMTMMEIVERSSLDDGIVTSRLTELGYRGIVDCTQGGEFSISFPKAEYFLEEARRNMLVEWNKSELPGENFESAESRMSPEASRRLLGQEAIAVLMTRRIV